MVEDSEMCSNKISTVRRTVKNKGMVPSTADSSGVQYSAKGYMEIHGNEKN